MSGPIKMGESCFFYLWSLLSHGVLVPSSNACIGVPCATRDLESTPRQLSSTVWQQRRSADVRSRFTVASLLQRPPVPGDWTSRTSARLPKRLCAAFDDRQTTSPARALSHRVEYLPSVVVIAPVLESLFETLAVSRCTVSLCLY